MSIDEAISEGGLWADLTGDGSFDQDDVGVLSQMLAPAPGGGGGEAQSGGGAGGCDPRDPFCNPQQVAGVRYDYHNQMVEYTDYDTQRLHRYHYDCFGRRVAKVMDAGSPPPFGAAPNRYVYGGQASWQILAEYSQLQPGPTDFALTHVYGNYIDEPIAMRGDFDQGVPTDTEDIYFHQDELFNVVALTAGPGGINHPSLGSFGESAVMERYRYGDYGNVTSTDAAGVAWGSGGWSMLGNRFTFTGRELDSEIGWLYYRTRYLEPEWGRFTTRDELGIWGDLLNGGSASNFVGSQPIMLADPFGWQAFDPLTSPVGPREPYFGPPAWYRLLLPNFTDVAKNDLREGARKACKRAQGALRVLSDPALKGCVDRHSKSTGVDPGTTSKRMRDFLSLFCRGGSSPRQFRFRPTSLPSPLTQGPFGDQSKDSDYWFPVDNEGNLKRGQSDLGTSILHEACRHLHDTHDEDDAPPGTLPTDMQHTIDDYINKLKQCSDAARAEHFE